ncbi:MAG: hypothetical protein AAGH78_00975 [Cyanobacteria bacterium P01_H01_bin.58]
MDKQVFRWSRVLAGWLLCLSVAGWRYAAPHAGVIGGSTPPSAAEASSLEKAFQAAITASEAAQAAQSAEEWHVVANEWATAIASLRAVPADDPQWIFAQRKAQEYLENQIIAQQQAQTAGMPIVFPSLGSEVLDEQLGIYLSYTAIFGPPDVMIVGSSRALQGINPQILQRKLTQQGIAPIQVYTFAVNGATAQVMNFLLQDLLTPEQLPRMVIWAGGSRSFNSAREDRTFTRIQNSPGFVALQGGDRPSFDWSDEARAASVRGTPPRVSTINGYGFLPVTDVFAPERYYRHFPRVSGRYDASYQPFQLDGVQTNSLRAIASYAENLAIPLVFVNLPLSSDYLDDTRLFYEQQFRQYLQQEAARGNFTVIDLLQEWPTQHHFFADPSHLNQIGAAQVAVYLSEDVNIPWQQFATLSSDSDSQVNKE